MKLRGMTNTAYMQIGRGWMDRRFSMVGGGGGEAPQKMKKKRLSEEILTYVILMKLGGVVYKD